MLKEVEVGVGDWVVAERIMPVWDLFGHRTALTYWWRIEGKVLTVDGQRPPWMSVRCGDGSVVWVWAIELVEVRGVRGEVGG